MIPQIVVNIAYNMHQHQRPQTPDVDEEQSEFADILADFSTADTEFQQAVQTLAGAFSRDPEPSTLRPLTMAELRQNTTTRPSRTSDEPCAICGDGIVSLQYVRTLRCDHYFHAACIERAMEERTTCPMCRAPVIATNSES